MRSKNKIPIILTLLFFIITCSIAQQSNLWRATTASLRVVVEIVGDTNNVIGLTPDEIKQAADVVVESKGFSIREGSGNVLLISFFANYHGKKDSNATVKLKVIGIFEGSEGLNAVGLDDPFQGGSKRKEMLLDQSKLTNASLLSSITMTTSSVVNLMKQEMLARRGHLDRRSRFFPSRINSEEEPENVDDHDW